MAINKQVKHHQNKPFNLQLHKPAFLAKPASKQAEKKKIFVRNPAEKLMNKFYIQNMLDSLNTVFMPWFMEGGSDYVSMIQSQHQIVIAGLDGKSRYDGLKQGSDRINSQIYGLHGFSRKQHTGKEWLWNWEHREWPNSLVPKVVKTQLANEIKEFNYQFRIFGIAEKYWPCYRLQASKTKLVLWQYFFVKDEAVIEYLQSLEVMMGKIRIDIQQNNLKALLNHLADYHQLFVIAHPFYRVNNSIAMMHINCILEALGFAGIVHANLDWYAHEMHSVSYRKLFRHAIEQENSFFDVVCF